MIQIVFAFLIFSVSAHSSPISRQHKIELKGMVANQAVKAITIEKLNEDFPQLETMKTKWREEGAVDLQGVSLKNFVAKYGAPGTSKIRAISINKYSQILTERDWDGWGAFLAFRESNGEPISTRKRGTFRLIYDYEKYEHDIGVINIIEANSVWQITQIEFLK